MLLTVISLTITAAALWALCLGDPKRRRTARLGGAAHSSTARRMLVVVGLLPGAALLLAAHGAGFLIWLGGSAIFGWLLTMGAAGRTDPSAK